MSRSDGSTADYYVLPEGATQLQDLISHRDMNSQIGEIFRACYRYGIVSHSDKMRDAKKIRFYAQAEVERLGKLAQVEEPSHIISDMDDWRNWKSGDTVVCVSHTNNWSRKINIGMMAVLDSVSESEGDGLHIEIHGTYMTPIDFKFVSRPTSTAQ